MENFIVSARKYRPATFASVVGQAHVSNTLKNAISRGQLAHAYLFCGPRGVGKTTCARIFAKAINCLNPVDSEACNNCESCKAFNEGRSFTIHELDAASNNSVDDIRSLTEQVRIPPQVGRYSVYIIDEVHMLSVQAFNAFLKTLEEPPAHAIFILATTEKHKIIPTILSRCQIYDFNRIKVEDSVTYLKYIADRENIKYDEESLHIISQKAEGGMRDALSMFDKVVSFCGDTLNFKQVAETLNVLDYDTYFRITDLVLEGNYAQLLLLFDDVLRKGFGGQVFVAGLNNHFRSLLMAKNPTTLPLLEVTGGVAKRYVQQAERCETALLFEAINLLTVTDSTFKTSSNQRLHIELALLKLSGLGQKKNIVTPNLPLPAPEQRSAAGNYTAARHTAASAEPQSQNTSTTRQATGGMATAGGDTGAQESAADTGASASTDGGIGASAGVGATGAGAGASTGIGMQGRAADTAACTHSADLETEHASAATQPPKTATPPVSEPQTSKRTTARPEAAKPSAGSLSGLSIRDLMSETTAAPASGDTTAESKTADAEEEIVIGEDTEEKIASACLEVSEELMKERPRLGVVFRNVSVTRNIINIKVANQPLKEEILRNKLELQRLIATHADIDCIVDFNIVIEIDNSFIRPIKMEDRFKYFAEKNANFIKLCKNLELEIG